MSIYPQPNMDNRLKVKSLVQTKNRTGLAIAFLNGAISKKQFEWAQRAIEGSYERQEGILGFKRASSDDLEQLVFNIFDDLGGAPKKYRGY